MINYTETITKEIDEEYLFASVKEFLFVQEADDGTIIEDLPKDVQRLIFAKIGAMMIDYAGSEDF